MSEARASAFLLASPRLAAWSFPTIVPFMNGFRDSVVGRATVVVAIVCLLPSWGMAAAPANTDPKSASDHLGDALACASTGEWKCTKASGNAAYQELASLTKAQRLQLHQVRAEAALALGDKVVLDGLLDTLVAANPAFVPPGSWTVPWVKALAAAMNRRADVEIPTAKPDPLLPVSHGQPMTIAVRLDDRSGVKVAILRVIGTQLLLKLRKLPATSMWQTTIPHTATTGKSMSFWVEATDNLDNRGPVWGTPEAPVVVAILQPLVVEPETGLAQKWWFWTIIGIGVVGIAGGVVGLLHDPTTRVKLGYDDTPL